jgi:hypothetical protein
MKPSKLASAFVFAALDIVRNEKPDSFNDMAARHARLTMTKTQRKTLFLLGQLWAETAQMNSQEMNGSRFMLAAYGIPPKRIPNISWTEAKAGVQIYRIMNQLAQPEDMFSEAALERGLSRVLGTVKMTRRTGCQPA